MVIENFQLSILDLISRGLYLPIYGPEFSSESDFSPAMDDVLLILSEDATGINSGTFIVQSGSRSPYIDFFNWIEKVGLHRFTKFPCSENFAMGVYFYISRLLINVTNPIPFDKGVYLLSQGFGGAFAAESVTTDYDTGDFIFNISRGDFSVHVVYQKATLTLPSGELLIEKYASLAWQR